jgi:diguanylate cyclase (GGDEF)-like protein
LRSCYKSSSPWTLDLQERAAAVRLIDMRYRPTSVSPSQPSPELLHRVFFTQQVCLALVVQITVVALCARFIAPVARVVPVSLAQMRSSFALAALFSFASLFVSDLDRSKPRQMLPRVFAFFTGIAALGSFFAPHAARVDGLALLLIATILFLARSTSNTAIRIADFATAGVSLLVLAVGSEYLYAVLHIPGSTLTGLPAPATLGCLILLTLAVVLHSAESGAFSIFLGPGIGGRIARGLTPFLLLLPIIREAGRAHLINAQVISPHYAAAILASVATIVSFGLLLFVVSRINQMETAIQDLTLRDELTGLYNVRGFNFLAAQSLRLAQRANLPFSVLFIDVDGLKRINDDLGHNVGSALLVETAKILYTTFRDADVIARIGGDEFIVAGQFNHEAIANSTQRLQDSVAERSLDSPENPPLSLSLGYATSSMFRFEFLKDLVDRADQAMYERKRRKKIAADDTVAVG